MTPERWQQIKHVFNSALEYEPAQRASFLSRACEHDTALRKEVESLLSAHEEDGSFIDSPAYNLGIDDQTSTLRAGQQVGGYEITSFIGRGGMGEVYLAQDQRLRRKVALNLLPAVFMARLFFNSGHRAQSELSSLAVSATGDPIGAPTIVMQPGNGVTLGSLDISRNGKRILYGVERTSSNLWTIPVNAKGDATGSPAVFISDTSSRNSLPRFSPDGTKIAINRWRPAMSVDIWIADANGKNLTQLTNNPGIDSQASWLPGGDKLAFLSDRDNGRLTLWTVSIATGKQEPLFGLGDGVQFASVSPDGNHVAYNLIQNGIVNIWLANIHDGQRKQLTFDNELARFPCWSPDGKLLAFEMKRGEDDYLMLLPANGGPATQLTFDKGKSWPNSFSPDGDEIVFAGQRDGVWNMYAISLRTKEQKRLTNYSKPNSFVRYPSWTGDQIVYEYSETTGNLWQMELE